MKQIVVLFKTHLDIGFTDLAANVVEKYNKVYIPGALAVAEEIAASDRSEGFIWTTGSWLVDQYLAQASDKQREQMCSAIAKGWMSWHALPFTMHSELCDGPLYNYSLSISQRLDARFGKQTIAAKNTDVPGHTIAIVPLLAAAGVRLLHIGVNAAATAPEVPDLFRWRAPDGQSVIVMYNKGGYGEFAEVPGTDTAVYFAHTEDNLGPQSAREILAIYDELHKKYPEAQIKAGDLNDVARLAMQIEDRLPVVTQEIGDTWIHGAGSDPQKMARYRALLRLAAGLSPHDCEALYSGLVMVPEHTWGLDEKTHLADNKNYLRPLFEQMRDDPRYLKMEHSWQEQRDYLDAATSGLGDEARAATELAQQALVPAAPSLEGMRRLEGSSANIKGWELVFGQDGSLCGLSKGERVFADADHRLGGFLYEFFSEREVNGFIDRFAKQRPAWALEDMGKIGLGNELESARSYRPICRGVWLDDQHACIALEAPREATYEQGCPPRFFMTITPDECSVEFDFCWFDKPANRVPEALWLEFCPTNPLTAIEKLGISIDPLDVVSGGNRELHATGRLTFGDIVLETQDAPLVAVGKPSVYGFYNLQPQTDRGVWVNLFNNQWGTNFPMWSSGDARFRFVLTADI